MEKPPYVLGFAKTYANILHPKVLFSLKKVSSIRLPPVHRLAGIFVMSGEKNKNVREAQWMRSASADVSTFSG
ncbi:MAG: hypothetical protein ACTTJE_07500 [Schwartzia sp. (in: firmicutes)]